MKYFNGNDWCGDCCIFQSFLNEMVFYSGTERKRIYKHSNLSGNIGSMLYGLTWRGYLSPTKTRTPSIYKGLYQTKCMDLYPEFYEVAREFSNHYFPDFEWCQIQLNKNFPIPPHFDSVNVGESIIVGFGDYEGGKLFVEYPSGLQMYDIQYATCGFDGSKYRHYVGNFTGERYSVVFFNNKMVMNKIKQSDL